MSQSVHWWSRCHMSREAYNDATARAAILKNFAPWDAKLDTVRVTDVQIEAETPEELLLVVRGTAERAAMEDDEQ